MSLGDVHGVIHAAGVSPSQAAPETILKVGLYGTALVLEEFGKVLAEGQLKVFDESWNRPDSVIRAAFAKRSDEIGSLSASPRVWRFRQIG
jgi:hypothetical protein